MKKCEVCNEVKLTTIQMGEATVCKKCFSKISNNWDNDFYFDRKELYEDRDETIKKAKDKNFPDAALKYINEYFEGKVNKNWICTLDGHKEQVLELYDDYLTIKTLDTFDDREMEKCLKTIMSDGHFSKEDLMILKKMGTELLSDILPFKLSRATKGVINSVSNAASEKLSRAAADSKSVSISNFVKTGKRKLLYNSCDNVKLLVSSYEDEVGVLLITSKKKDTSDYLFFFEMQYKDKVNKIKKIITEKIVLNENKKQEEKPSDGSVASEIRQLKGLLDEGLITEAEFEAKKKQLLGI